MDHETRGRDSLRVSGLHGDVRGVTGPGDFLAFQPQGAARSRPQYLRRTDRGLRRDRGVVGINGVGDFLGDSRSETVVKNIEYVLGLVGPEHVGLGLDYVVDQRELFAYFKSHPDKFPADTTKNYVDFVAPEQHPEIAGLLLARGHSADVVRKVMSANFFRVAQQVWKTA